MCVACATSLSFATDMNASTHQENAAFVAARLESCLVWTALPENDTRDREAVIDVYLDIARFPTGDIREGIKTFSVKERDLLGSMDARAKVFALLRVVFLLPKGLVDVGNLKNARDFASAKEPAVVNSGKVDLLWPITVDADGRLRLTGVAVAGRWLDFSPVEAFDELADRFPRRSQANPKGP